MRVHVSLEMTCGAMHSVRNIQMGVTPQQQMMIMQ